MVSKVWRAFFVLAMAMTLVANAVTGMAASKGGSKITDPAKAKERLDRISEEAHRIYGRHRSMEELDRFLVASGLTRVEEKQGESSGDVGILTSSPAGVTIRKPQAYSDSATGEWVYFGTLDWGSYPSWYSDIPMPDCGTGCSLGGFDGVALTIQGVDSNTQISGWKLTTYTYDNAGLSTTTASTNEAYGVTFLVNDQVFYSKGMYYNGWNYTLDGYLIEMRLRNVPAASTITVQHKYFHSYKTGSVDGIGLSVGSDGKISVDVQYTNQSETWPATSLPAYF